MDGGEIADILLRDPFVQPAFHGVFSSDHLPQMPVKQRPAAFVVNTDPSRRPGEHWIAISYQNVVLWNTLTHTANRPKLLPFEHF